jgi:hypothetical protein
VAKPIILNHGGAVSTFDHSKVDRKKIYGKKVRMSLDPTGEVCASADLPDDGWMLVRRGMAAQGYFDDAGRFLSSRDLKGLDEDGNVLASVSSTLGVEQSLEGPIEPEELLDLKVSSIYALTPLELSDALSSALDGGKLFRFSFNYRTDFQAEVGVLLKNKIGVFALVGMPVESDWCELDQPQPVISFEEEEDSDDLDFDMF